MGEKNNENKNLFEAEVVDSNKNFNFNNSNYSSNLNYNNYNATQKKKMSDGDFYLLAFIIGFIAFYVVQLLFQLVGFTIMEARSPGFVNSFQLALANGTSLTDEMWGVQNISQFAGESFLAILMIIFLGRRMLVNFKEFKKDYGRNFSFIILGFFIMIGVNLVMNFLYEKVLNIHDTSDNQKLIEAALASSSGIFMTLTVIFLAPFVEEIIHRFLIFGMLEKKFRLKPIFAIIISAAIFAALHLQSLTDVFFFRYFAMGLVLSGVYSISKNNLLVAMGVHFINNALPFLFMVI